ncbi:MAG: site-specific integrase [Acidobacteriota bacterium]|nr:site-specific integrase [Acidobacteriota bacterium]
MAIRKFYTKREKRHWKYDAKAKLYWSYGYDIRLDGGRRVREAGFVSETDAVAAVGRIRQMEKESKHGFITAGSAPTIVELIEKRLASIRNPRERSRSTRILGDLASVLTPKMKVPELKSAHLQLFVDRRLTDGIKPQSVNREMNSIVACLNAARLLFASLDQWVPPRAPRPKAPKGRRERVITSDEVNKLLRYLLAPRQEGEREAAAQARRDVGIVLRFALLTGLRHGELNRLRWDHLDGSRSLKVIGTKTEMVTNSTRYITPLTETMLAILEERRRLSSSPFIFTRSGDMPPTFYQVLRRACEACGIPYGRETEGGLVLHDARHTATTQLLQAGLDLATIQSVTGHSDKVMVLYYSHASQASRERAAAALEAYAGDPGPAEPQPDASEYFN